MGRGSAKLGEKNSKKGERCQTNSYKEKYLQPNKNTCGEITLGRGETLLLPSIKAGVEYIEAILDG